MFQRGVTPWWATSRLIGILLTLNFNVILICGDAIWPLLPRSYTFGSFSQKLSGSDAKFVAPHPNSLILGLVLVLAGAEL